MKSKIWIVGFIILIIIPLAIVVKSTVDVDPYFHYHAPDTSKYYYTLNNQRSQNDGITKHFDYEGLITGTSMTENFKASEAEQIFGCPFIKVCYSGGTFKEINDSLKIALSHNKKLKIIIRGLDMEKYAFDKDSMRTDLGDFPTYLYNDNPFDDVRYLFNRDILFTRVYPMIKESKQKKFTPGITSFDAYSNWMADYTFGVKSLVPEDIPTTDRSVTKEQLTDEEKETIIGNIRQNVTSLAEEYPDVTFYYFITPYSMLWWQELVNYGIFDKQMETERIVVEEIIKTPNIKLFSLNNETDIITDLNNYKDNTHYGEWINSLILKYMKEGRCQITEANYEEYLKKEKEYYWNLDFEKTIAGQKDYDNDYEAAVVAENRK